MYDYFVFQSVFFMIFLVHLLFSLLLSPSPLFFFFFFFSCLVSPLTCLFFFSFSSSLFFSFFFFSFSLSFTAHTETTSTRQVTPPTKNGHAPRDPLNQERAINLSILAMSHPGKCSRVESNQAASSTPGGAHPSMPDYHVHPFYLRFLGLDPAFLEDTQNRKINGRKPFTKRAAEDVNETWFVVKTTTVDVFNPLTFVRDQ